MNRFLFGCCVAVLGASFVAPAAPASVSFSREIAPILVRKCVECHGPTKAKGEYRLHTFEDLMVAGASRTAAVVRGQPAQSRLYQLIRAPDPTERMPQKAEALAPREVDLIRRWIEEGAVFDGPNRAQHLVELVPRGTHPSAPTVYDHRLPVTALAVSPDGQFLVAGGYHELLVFAGTNCVRRVGDCDQRTYDLAFHPDGRRLAVASGAPGRSGEVKLIEFESGGTLFALARLPDVALAVAFDPAGDRVAAGGADNRVRIYDARSGEAGFAMDLHTDWIMDLTFARETNKLVSASRDKSVRVVDLGNGENTLAYLEHESPVMAVWALRDGKRICSADAQGEVHLWELETGKKLEDFKAGRPVQRLAGHDDELWVAGADGLLRVYDVGSKASLVREYGGMSDQLYALALGPAGKELAVGGYEGRIIWWARDGSDKLRETELRP